MGAAVTALLAVAPLRAQTDEAAQRIARDLAPQVERASGLRFRRPPVISVRTREQVRQYLNRKMAREYPPAELAGIQRTYRAFRLIPDTLDLRQLVLDLYAEQVAGFYDPDSAALFVVRGADAQMLRLVMAHELVHALQDQHMPLNRILDLRRQNDRQMAGQAVAEGQATIASMMALAPGMDLPDLSGMWSGIREAIRQQQTSMPVFAAAPLLLQESMIFPYLAGAEFMRGFEERRGDPDEQPWGDRLPISTEQILHPGKYTGGERPLRLSFAATAGDTLVWDDDFGEFETRSALMTWGATEPEALAAAAGWGGDRYEVRGTRGGTVVLWATAWDTPQDAQDFARQLRRQWERAVRSRPDGQRWQVDTLTVRGTPIVRLTDAPASWPGWRSVPAVSVAPWRP
jgi:hypothetical protein